MGQVDRLLWLAVLPEQPEVRKVLERNGSCYQRERSRADKHMCAQCLICAYYQARPHEQYIAVCKRHVNLLKKAFYYHFVGGENISIQIGAGRRMLDDVLMSWIFTHPSTLEVQNVFLSATYFLQLPTMKSGCGERNRFYQGLTILCVPS